MGMASLIAENATERSHALCAHCSEPIPAERQRNAIYCSQRCNRDNWKKRNPAKHAEAAAKYRAANREECNRRSAEWAKRKPDQRQITIKAWREANPERVKELDRASKQRRRQSDPEGAYFRKKASHLKGLYGLTLDGYADLLELQDGCCAICRSTPDKPFGLHVDHDHETGAVRGLLCKRCNPMIGLSLESPATLRAAADYLEV